MDGAGNPICSATWDGDSDILPFGAPVDVLAVDPAGRMSRKFGLNAGVPARTACWVRYWPEDAEFAQFRSCDLADLVLDDAQFDKLSQPNPPKPPTA